MTSVDLAFAGIAQTIGADRVTYWRLWDQTEWLSPPGGSTRTKEGYFADSDSELIYRPMRGHLDEVLDADCVVYWGDFLHMAVYQRQTADVLTRRMNAYASAEQAEEVTAQHLLLRGQPAETLSRVLSYGTTLSLNTPADYAGTYGSDLEAFLSRTQRVWHRDLYSSQVAALARMSHRDVTKGVDAAFLLDVGDPRDRNSELGVFIGRSDLRPEPVARFGSELAKRLDLRPKWIPWGYEPAFWPMAHRRRFRVAWPGLEHHSARPTFPQRQATYLAAARGADTPEERCSTRQLIDQIATCQFVLTDTYHLAVNAWREGTPAVCVIDRPRSGWSVNSGDPNGRRDKREELYSQLDALGLIVDGSRLNNPRLEADRIAERLLDAPGLAVTMSRLERLRSRSRSELTAAMGGLLHRQA
jgi:hypothetical protein